MKITDHVLAIIDNTLAARPPEHGGILLGTECQSFVLGALCDPESRPALEAWSIDANLTRQLAEVECSEVWLRLIGVIHTHPGGIDEPSRQDLRAAADLLARNPALGRVFIPIVTRWCDLPEEAAAQLADHEIALEHGKVSCYVMYRGVPGEEPLASTVRPRIVPVQRDATTLAHSIDGVVTSIGTTELESVTYARTTITMSTDMALTVLMSSGYPVAAPLVLVGEPGQDQTYPLPVSWDLTVSEQERIVTALDLNGTGIPGHPEMEAEATAASDDKPSATDAADLTARVRAPLGGSIAGLDVVVVGLGSVGSTIADTLVRTGVDRIALIDPDTVDGVNLSRSPYLRSAIGRFKADALADHLRAINPDITVTPLVDDITTWSASQLSELLDPASLVIAATDAAAAQDVINAAAFATNCPAVYIGLYARAAAGEVILTVPGLTRCYRCAAPTRRHQPDRPDTDYGTGRLNGEPALGCDITRVTMTGARFALALLAQQTGADTALTRHLMSVLGRDNQFLITATEPDWGMFAGLLADVPGQNGFSSAWLSIDENPDCAICGEHPQSLEQLIEVHVDRDAIAAALETIDFGDTVARGEDQSAEPSQLPVSPLADLDIDSDIDAASAGEGGVGNDPAPSEEESLGELIRFRRRRSG